MIGGGSLKIRGSSVKGLEHQKIVEWIMEDQMV